ncbi:uncharacterized protein IUM83_18190 [Phytophthora cinnamomi]|uniref:uncharacterized protein n=1 Tax=Phytophthora cinnamomi TaxID=4785 RepID=UPI00355A5EC1|nr:hypothetical protein IUM83_18190 [Phytophthora cinnamomi]
MNVDEDAEELDDPMFGEAWLDAAGGIENVASGTVNAAMLKDMGANGWSDPVSYGPFPYLDEPFEQRPIESLREDYPHLYDGPYGPTPRALESAASPAGAFFFFARPRLWESIAEASNEYFEEKLDERVDGQYAKQVAREQKKSAFTGGDPSWPAANPGHYCERTM